MKIPLEWLKEYVAIRLKPEALAHRLTMAGLEVTGIEPVDGEPVFDVEITPNRADWLSIIGVAREVAALTGQRLKVQRPAPGTRHPVGAKRPRPQGDVKVVIEDRQGCSRYIGRVIEGVTIGPSPAWMQQRLLACGARPINNIVDITNYVLFEYGQPLHAFDLQRLAGRTILVRRARAAEPITTLDGVTRKLTADVLVIADAQHPVAVAGIMGGLGSEVTAQTTDVLLESAFFDPRTIRRTARSLGLMSESSYRFERGVDPMGVDAASARAARLMHELAGGTETAAHDVGTTTFKRTMITLDATRVTQLLGVPVSAPTLRTTFARLSCHVASGGASSTMRVAVPSFRRDLTQDVDLIEEVARVTGYEHVPALLPTTTLRQPQAAPDHTHEQTRALRERCAGLGLTEAVTWSLISEGDLTRCRLDATRAARLANPLSQDHAYLRPTLLVGLLDAVRRNLTQGAPGARLFEIGHVTQSVLGQADGTEYAHLGIILSGLWARDWQAKTPADFFRLKGLVTSIVQRTTGARLQMHPASPAWAEPRQGADISIDGRAVGVAAQVARSIAQGLDLEADVWFAELSVPALFAVTHAASHAHAPAAFPPVKRDVSLIIDHTVPFAAIQQVMRETGRPLATAIELIDRYVGKQIPAGKTSLTFSIEYRDPARTLTAEEVDAVHQRIGQTLTTRFGVTLR